MATFVSFCTKLWHIYIVYIFTDGALQLPYTYYGLAMTVA